MTYSTPWTPKLNETECAPCAQYASVQQAVPNSFQHPAWAQKNLKAELDKTPEVREALWESILELWRLDLIAEQSRQELNWQRLVSAWLHRHQEICVSAHITPYKIISDHATNLHTNQLLPLDMIPPWDKATSIPSSKPEQPPNQTQSHQPRKRRSEARMTPSNAHRNRNVEIVEQVPRTTQSAQKRKQPAQPDDDVSVSVEGSQVERSDSKSATLETGHQEMPQVQKQLKRPQETVAPAPPEVGLDLSNYEFEEKSRIGDELPAIRGMVCNACAGRSICRPIWCKGEAPYPISCELCLYQEGRCSFRWSKWGVRVWPNLKPEQSFVGRLATHGAKLGTMGPTLHGMEEGRCILSSGGQRDVFQDILSLPGPARQVEAQKSVSEIAVFAPNNPPASSSQPPPHSQPCSGENNSTVVAMLSTKLGSEYKFYLQPLIAFEDTLWDEEGSPVDARMAAVMLDAVRRRERGELEGLIRLIEGREAIANHLIKGLLEKADLHERENDSAAGAANKDAQDVGNTSRDHGDTEMEVTRGHIEGVEDLGSVNQAAMEGVESDPTAATDTTLNRDRETT